MDRVADSEQRHVALQGQLRDVPPRGPQGVAVGALARERRSAADARGDRDADSRRHGTHARLPRHGRLQHRRPDGRSAHRRGQRRRSKVHERSELGATNFDKKFRAFDKLTGKLLWETTLPAAGNATPSTYTINGKQYVVIVCGGKNGAPSGSSIVAFALP